MRIGIVRNPAQIEHLDFMSLKIVKEAVLEDVDLNVTPRFFKYIAAIASAVALKFPETESVIFGRAEAEP